MLSAIALIAKVLLATALTTTVLIATAQATTSEDRLRLLMERNRQQAGGVVSGNLAASVSPDRLKERSDLLAQGEGHLANLRVDAAQQAFEKAALILHAADSEMALVRSFMQGGDYRRALAFGAHTAGAHLDVVGGSALYAWLLFMGGQESVAKRLLDATLIRIPDNPLIKSVQQQLASGAPAAAGELLALPLRLAPYSEAIKLPRTALVSSSGVLLPDMSGQSPALGRFALIPLSRSNADQTKVWLRNGLGQVSAATVMQRLPRLGLTIVRLASPLPLPDGFAIATAEAFPGSVGYAVQYSVFDGKPNSAPAWPQLHVGFVGGMAVPQNAASQDRLLGIGLQNDARGGPVFNAAGHWIGVAVRSVGGKNDLLITSAQLTQALGNSTKKFGLVALQKATLQSTPAPITSAVPALSATAISVDRIYEASLKSALQVITIR